jgi:hypothetical protein
MAVARSIATFIFPLDNDYYWAIGARHVEFCMKVYHKRTQNVI